MGGPDEKPERAQYRNSNKLHCVSRVNLGPFYTFGRFECNSNNR
jgi:hypothetical protein